MPQTQRGFQSRRAYAIVGSSSWRVVTQVRRHALSSLLHSILERHSPIERACSSSFDGELSEKEKKKESSVSSTSSIGRSATTAAACWHAANPNHSVAPWLVTGCVMVSGLAKGVERGLSCYCPSKVALFVKLTGLCPVTPDLALTVGMEGNTR